jgi:hypothetical protein
VRTPRWLGRRESIAWVVIPALGSWWHAHNLRDTWWFFDDWSLIERVLNVPLAEGLTTGFNGHFWMIGYLMYRVQVFAIGLESHTFIAAMCVACGLVLLVAIAAALRGGGVSTVVSLLIAAHVAYLGPGAQNMLFAVQAASMLTVGLCIGAGAVALTRPPNPTTMLLVGGALVVAVAGDSGHALSGILFASIVVLRSWRGKPRLVLVPGVAAVVSWHVLGDLSERWPGSVGTRASFAASLLTHTTGALIGRGGSAGAVMLCATIALVTIGLRAGFVTGRSRTLLVAAGASLVLVLAAIARRAPVWWATTSPARTGTSRMPPCPS